MRISAWSSDVCSSDLREAAEAFAATVAKRWPQVKLVTVLPKGSDASIREDVFVDTSGDLARQWGANAAGWAAMLRPATYIHAPARADRLSVPTAALGDTLAQACRQGSGPDRTPRYERRSPHTDTATKTRDCFLPTT